MANLDWLIGEYNNFQQYWKENTDEEMHRVESEGNHKHLHLKCVSSDVSGHYLLSFFKGRDTSHLLAEYKISVKNNSVRFNDEVFSIIGNREIGNKGSYLKSLAGAISISGLGIIEECTSDPYQFLPCRYFSGWIQYPPDISEPDKLYSVRDLEIHDQGGYVELKNDSVVYTAELTQLVYAKTLKIMKLAIYDLPKSEVDINSKAICYAWTNPEDKRIGINIRRVLSGWTLMEPGYVNSNNLNKSTK